MNRIRALALIAALFSGLLQAAELKVAILVQDTAQLSMQGDLVPGSTPGADLVAAELNPQPLPPKLVLRPRADVSAKDTSFEVHLRFSGSEERFRYFIVPDQAPSTTVNRIGPLGEEL